MTSILVALACSGLASLWALHQLRAVGTFLHFQPAVLSRALERNAGPASTERFERALRTEHDAWEASMVSKIVQAASAEQARAEANVALLDMDGGLMLSTNVYAACARIAVLGCFIGVAVLFMQGAAMSGVVLDVFTIGAAGVLISLAAGREARRLVKRKREEVDAWVEILLRLRWPHQG